jgi:hypothetical protein
MPFRNNYWRSIIGKRAQVLMSLGVAYTSQATYNLFVANSAQGEMGVFNASTLALISGGAAVGSTVPVFIAVNRGGVKGTFSGSPVVPNVIETSIIFQAGWLTTALRQAYSAPILQSTAVYMSSHASVTIQDLTFVAKAAGASSPITVTYVVAGNSTALSVSVTSNAITINLATSAGGAAISTAAQVQAAVIASAPALALVNTLLTGSGSNVEVAAASTGLAGGTASPTVVAGNVYNLAILETTIGFQQFPTWYYEYTAKAGDTEDSIMALFASRINNTTSIENRDRDLCVTATYAAGVLTLTAIYYGATFNVFFPGLYLSQLNTDNTLGGTATVVTIQTAHAGSGSADQARMFQLAGDVYKGIVTNYPEIGVPLEYGYANDFVALNTVQNFDIITLEGVKQDGSKTFLHKQLWDFTIFILVPTSGTTPTVALQTIFTTG